MTYFYIWLAGFAVATVIFYHGALRGKARYPEIFSVLFGLVWFITLPLVLVAAVNGILRDK